MAFLRWTRFLQERVKTAARLWSMLKPLPEIRRSFDAIDSSFQHGFCFFAGRRCDLLSSREGLIILVAGAAVHFGLNLPIWRVPCHFLSR